MKDDGLSEKFQKLLAIAERLAAAPPTPVVVNVYTDSKKKASAPISGKEVGDHEIPTPGGQPRPYVS